jgi:hypothetical protein
LEDLLAQIAAQEELLVERDAKIAEQKELIEGVIEEQRATIIERDAKIAEQKELIEGKIDEQKAIIAARDEEIEAQQVATEEDRTPTLTLLGWEVTIKEHAAKIREQKEVIQIMQNHLDGIMSSTRKLLTAQHEHGVRSPGARSPRGPGQGPVGL